MLSFVERWANQRKAENRKRAIVAFRSLVEALTPLAYVRPTLARVTAQSPFCGVYLEDDMTLALQPDGTALKTHMIDGYAIDDLWLGFDKATCQKYLNALPDDSPRLLPVYAFTESMVEPATTVVEQPMSADIYAYVVEYKDYFLPLTLLEFRRRFISKQPIPARAKPALQHAA